MKNCHQYNYVKCCVFWDVSCSKLLIDRKPHKTEIEILAMLGTLNRVWKKKKKNWSGTIRLVQYPLSPPLSSADVNEARDWVLMSASFDPKWRIQSDLCTVLHLRKRHHHKSGIVCLYGSSYYVLCFQIFNLARWYALCPQEIACSGSACCWAQRWVCKCKPHYDVSLILRIFIMNLSWCFCYDYLFVCSVNGGKRILWKFDDRRKQKNLLI